MAYSGACATQKESYEDAEFCGASGFVERFVLLRSD
jgi:hypothetical protein